MAGTFAHIALVQSLCSDNARLKAMTGLTNPMKLSLSKFANFCELGAVSPDCPFLVLGDDNATGWGNVMHYWNTADFIRNAAPMLSASAIEKDMDAQRAFAWLCGYTAHVVTDLTIHPIVGMKVGEYFGHETEHRKCEMHQDVYIFNKLFHRDITAADYLSEGQGGIGSCHADKDDDKLHPSVSKLWLACLSKIPLKDVRLDTRCKRPTGNPNPDHWYHRYMFMLDKVAEEGGKLPFLGRFTEKEALFYPGFKDLNRDYVDNLKKPDGTSTTYDQVFAEAQKNVVNTWVQLGNAITKNDPAIFALANANLDNGLDASGKSVFWS